VFLVTTLVIARPRPTVPRLDVSPPTSSFPSGHTAAAIALYVGLAIIVGRHVRNGVVRSLVWTLAILIPCFVGVSRVYRGMHHPTDVLGSIPLGVAALLVASLAICSAVEARVCRERPRVVEESPPTAVEKVAS
jgi:membrane-associated phospholipid phosphatase